MPKPRKGEKKSDFIHRCIPIVLNEGTAKSAGQAWQVCNSIYKEHKRG